MALIWEATNFLGGINLSSGGLSLASNEASYCNNAIPYKSSNGGIQKALGNLTKVDLGDEIVLGLKEFKFADGTLKLIAITETKIFTINTSTWAATAIKTGLTTDANLIDMNFSNETILVTKNGNVPQTVTKADAVAAMTGWPPVAVTGNPTQIEIFNDRVIMTGNPTNPAEEYWSERGSISSYNAQPCGGGFVTIPAGDKIETNKVYGDDVNIVYTSRNVYFWTGDTPPDEPAAGLNNYKISHYASIQNFHSPFAVVNGVNSQYFWNDLQIVDISKTNKGTGIENGIISQKLRERLSTINRTYLKNMIGYYLGNEYNQIWWFYPTSSSTVNNELLILDLDTGSFYICEDRKATCICQLSNGTILTGHTDGTIKQQLTGYLLDGVSFDFEWRTGWIKSPIPSKKISLQKIEVYHELSGNFSFYVDIYKDYNDSYDTYTLVPTETVDVFDDDSSVFDDAIFDSETIAKSVLYYMGSVEALKIGIRHTEDAQTLKLLNIKVYGS